MLINEIMSYQFNARKQLKEALRLATSDPAHPEIIGEFVSRRCET